MEINVSVECDKRKFKKDVKTLLVYGVAALFIISDEYKKFEKKYIGDFFDTNINWIRVGKAIFICFSPILTLMILANL